MSKPKSSVPKITVMSCSLRDYVVVLTTNHDDTWTRHTLEIAEFEKKEDAEAFIEGIKNLLKLAKPKKVLCNL
jgi:hypothetical protein